MQEKQEIDVKDYTIQKLSEENSQQKVRISHLEFQILLLNERLKEMEREQTKENKEEKGEGE